MFGHQDKELQLNFAGADESFGDDYLGEYAMPLLRTSASLAVELRGDLGFQPGETREDGPPPGFHSRHRQVKRSHTLRLE